MKIGQIVRGTVIFSRKGYFFIRVNAVSEDVFGHLENVATGKMPKIGAEVKFTVAENARGFLAMEIEVIE